MLPNGWINLRTSSSDWFLLNIPIKSLRDCSRNAEKGEDRIGHDLGQRVRIIQKRNRGADLKILSWKVSFCGFMESQERILQLDHSCSHWWIKLPMKFFAPIMRYILLLTYIDNQFSASEIVRYWCKLFPKQNCRRQIHNNWHQHFLGFCIVERN